jgi:HEPN domain-containing protein
VLAKHAHRSKTPLHNGVCFHCQQCAEKYLKGLMEELGLSVPKVHDLEELVAALLPHHVGLRSLGRGMPFLTNFAVGTRYPGKNASRRQAEASLGWAERVRKTARSLLAIRERKR